MPSNNPLSGVKPAAALSGVVSLFTATFYRLAPVTLIPIEPLADILPGVTQNRVTFDMVDQETYTQSYRVTRNVLQDFTDTTPNVYREPIQLSVSGTFSGVGPLLPLGQVPLSLFRFDLFRINQLENIAARREPIAVVSPRVSLPYCFIESIQRPWTPAEGESTLVTVNLIEARIIRPRSVDVLADATNLAAGDVQAVSSGGAGGAPANVSVGTAAPVAQTPHIINTVPA